MNQQRFVITKSPPPNMTVLRMLSLDSLDKVAKRLDFHSTAILLLDVFDRDITSLNFTRLHSTPLDSLNKVAKRLDFSLNFLSSKKSSERSSRFARAVRDSKAIIDIQ